MTQKVWSSVVLAAAKGKTAGTFDSVGTITLSKQNATTILGFSYLVVPSAITSGENGIPILRVNSKSLSITNEDFVLSKTVLGDGITTNDKEVFARAGIIFFKAQADKSLFNAKIDISISGSVTTTGGWTSIVGTMFADSEPDQAYQMELMALDSLVRCTGGAYSSDGAKVTTTAATALTGITVPSQAYELIGLFVNINANAPTSGEETAGYVEFLSGQIDDFSPQQWPSCLGLAASLGTPVGQANIGEGFYWPVRFPLPGVEFTLNSQCSLAAALSNAADVLTAVKFR